MKTKTLTPQLKLQRGLTLSAEDIQALLKDPNSWVSKLYNECILIAAITQHEFIRLVHLIMQEQKLAVQALENEEHLRAEREAEKESQYYAELYSQQVRGTNLIEQNEAQQFALASLRLEMADLLAVPQHNMTHLQLAKHHKQITANFNNQIAAALGPAFKLPVNVNNSPQMLTLAVPQMTNKSIASAAEIVAHNPALSAELKLKPSLSNHFAKHAALACAGYLVTLNKCREILEHNREILSATGINIDDIQLNPHMVKIIDHATQSCLDANAGLLEKLIENNKYAIHTPPSLAKLPTLFAKDPAAKVELTKTPKIGIITRS